MACRQHHQQHSSSSPRCVIALTTSYDHHRRHLCSPGGRRYALSYGSVANRSPNWRRLPPRHFRRLRSYQSRHHACALGCFHGDMNCNAYHRQLTFVSSRFSPRYRFFTLRACSVPFKLYRLDSTRIESAVYKHINLTHRLLCLLELFSHAKLR